MSDRHPVTAPDVDLQPEPVDPPAAQDTQPVVEEVWPTWGRDAVATSTISLSGLQTAEFMGTQSLTAGPTQADVTRLEDFLRSHAIGGTSRKSEGYYGPKTRDLVNDAYAALLPGVRSSGVVGPDLAVALRAKGAVVGP
jgi:hypothetical protein